MGRLQLRSSSIGNNGSQSVSCVALRRLWYQCWLLFLLWSLLQGTDVIVKAQGDALVEPTVVESSNGVLDVTITIEYGDFSGPNYTFTNTRLFNGTYPGPTLKLNPGDTMRILFVNMLEEQADSVKTGDNVYKLPDTSNLHWHGSHVPGELPSDDVRLEVGPQETYQYEVDFPDNHLPGTLWIHPHMHGSSALHVGGGAMMALIVNDQTDTGLPSDISDATERLLIVHSISQDDLQTVIDSLADSTFTTSFTGSNTEFRTVNGQYQPDVAMTINTWERWRIIWADWLGSNLDFQFAGGSSCEMQLLAKDSIYISDYPREVNQLTISTGGRADIMIRCTEAGTYEINDYGGSELMTITVTDDGTTATDLTAFTPTYPEYLTSLTSTDPTDGCSCTTNMTGCTSGGGFCVNDNKFDSSLYIHTIAFGSVVERILGGLNRHPYHHHVYPFQLVGGVDDLPNNNENTYFQTGDWHDVVRMRLDSDDDLITVRYTANVHTGTLMLHCHILGHEDRGTMAQELIVDGGTCACDALVTTPDPTPAPSAAPSVSKAPSNIPSELPSAAPSVSKAPSNSPSLSVAPSECPSDKPSTGPSISSAPSLSPSGSPSVTPSKSVSPSIQPSLSKIPSASPSAIPSLSPSESPSATPSKSASPSIQPSISTIPSETPSTSAPTTSPSATPSEAPSQVAGPLGDAGPNPGSPVAGGSVPALPPTPTPPPLPTSKKCADGETLFQLQLQTDAFGEDISWTLTDDCDSEVVATSGNMVHEDRTTYRADICVPSEAQYKFDISDTFGDGLCCNHVDAGFYSIYFDGKFVHTGGDFQFGESSVMGLCQDQNI